MSATGTLLRPSRRAELLSEVRDGARLDANLLLLVLTIVVFGSIYGAVLGMWRSPLLAGYVAIKFPLLLISTALVTSLFNWISASMMGVPLRYGQVMVVTFFALAIAAVALASMAPIAWFITISLPPPTTGARTVHNFLYLIHTLLVGAAGMTGTLFLGRLLQSLAPPSRARKVYATWLLAFALVGGELGWLLRPFVGSVYQRVEFVRAQAFDRNVYEFIATDIVPHLFKLNEKECTCK